MTRKRIEELRTKYRRLGRLGAADVNECLDDIERSNRLVITERERCAKLCEAHATLMYDDGPVASWLRRIAEEIRRGQNTDEQIA